jgi:chromosome partitioning protein
MDLIDTLNDAISRSMGLITGVARGQFGDESPEARRITRRFGLNEASEMVGVSRTAIEKAEGEGRLPAPEMTESKGVVRTTRRAGYTLEQIDVMRRVFGTCPWRAADDPALVLSIDGNKGGCYKTATNVHLAQWLSLQGYRVLLIDIDQQGHASMYFGYVPGLHVQAEDTVLPWMLGERDDLTYCVKPTAWPNLDLIPACLDLQQLESRMPAVPHLPAPEHLMLRHGIETVSDDYDIILIDGHPDLGIGTINQICASDIILVATSCEINDYMSSAQYFTAVRDALAQLDLGGYQPVLKVLLTKLGPPQSSSQWMASLLREELDGLVLPGGISVTDEVGKGQMRMMTIFEQDKDNRSSISAWRRALAIYEPIFRHIEQQLILPQWPSKWEKRA